MSEQAPQSQNNPQFGNEVLARMGDEGAQRQLDMANYLSETPSDASEVSKVPTPAEMVDTAADDFTDENIAKGYGQLIEDLNKSRNGHSEEFQVLDKNKNVITRNKEVQADPTRTDDLFDALASKLAATELTDDGLLTVLGQMDKKLKLNDVEVSTVIDKIAKSREAAKLAKQEAKVSTTNTEATPAKETQEAELTTDPFASAPDVSTKGEAPVEPTPVKTEETVVVTVPTAVNTFDKPPVTPAFEQEAPIVTAKEQPVVESTKSEPGTEKPLDVQEAITAEKRKSVAYKLGYWLGKRRAVKLADSSHAGVRPIDMSLADAYDKVSPDQTASSDEVVEGFADVNQEELTKLSDDELRVKYQSMDSSDHEGIAKIVNELEVRDWFLSLDNSNAKDEAALQILFNGLDTDVAAEEQKAANEEAGVQRAFAELDKDNSANQQCNLVIKSESE